VEQNTNCPGSSAVGTLFLGAGAGASACQEIPASYNLVVITSPDAPPTTSNAGGTIEHRFLTINGVSVNTDSGNPPTTFDVPSLNVHITATGPEAIKVLHTIRRSAAPFPTVSQ
jgi:hypothetical protein